MVAAMSRLRRSLERRHSIPCSVRACPNPALVDADGAGRVRGKSMTHASNGAGPCWGSLPGSPVDAVRISVKAHMVAGARKCGASVACGIWPSSSWHSSARAQGCGGARPVHAAGPGWPPNEALLGWKAEADKDVRLRVLGLDTLR
jgi:hypothetical protein